jgi:hypothetical protein
MLLILDTTTMAMTEVPFPPDYYTGERWADWIQLVETDAVADGWILKQFGEEYPIVASVFVDGAWTADPTIIQSVVPVTPFSSYGMGSPWNGLDPHGQIVWTLPDKVAYWSEGPWRFQDDDIELLVVCERYDPTTDGGSLCVAPGLVAVDGESGTILWELPGHRQVAAIGDGYAIVSDTNDLYDGSSPTSWFMIDTATGETIDGQVWNYETFETNYYSMEEDGIWVRRVGGIVIAVNGQHIRVWMPGVRSNGTVEVSLPA